MALPQRIALVAILPSVLIAVLTSTHLTTLETWGLIAAIVAGILSAMYALRDAVRTGWRWAHRPKLTVSVGNTSGDVYGLNSVGAYAKYIHIDVSCNKPVQCRARAVGLKRESTNTAVPGFAPIELRWHGEQLYGEIEPDIPAKLNLVCTESIHPKLTTLCVSQNMHNRGHVTRVDPDDYVITVRLSSQYGDHTDKKFRFHAPEKWDDLRVEML